MKTYESLNSLTVYTTQSFIPPKGADISGYGSILFLNSPSRESGYNEINKRDCFCKYYAGGYKHYAIDFIYKEKVGFKKYIKNNTGLFKSEFPGMMTNAIGTMRLVDNSNRVNVLKKQANLIVNLGEWNKIFFEFQVRSSIKKICLNYLSFLSSRISTDEYLEYTTKALYINLEEWLSETNKLSFHKNSLTNPISILLVTLCKFPDLLAVLQDCDIILVSPSQYKILRVSNEDLTKKNYGKIKQKVLSIISRMHVDEESLNESMLDDSIGSEQNKTINRMNTNELVNKIVDPKKKQEEIERRKKEITSRLTKNLLGETDDITENVDDFYKDIEDEEVSIYTDDEKINEITNIANNYLDEHQELLDTDPDDALEEVSKEVKKKYYIREFGVQYSDKKLEEIQRLRNVQDSTIGNLDDEIANMESKTIDVSDFSDTLSTSNPNIVTSRFVNFDKSYNKKKLPKDIDNSVGMLANASTKVFIVDKEEIDSSTPLDLKKTMIYHLQDENGKKMTLKFDVPVIIDDHFMMIKGNKKIIQHTLLLKPLVKTGTNTVQIVTNYQKMFIMRRKETFTDLKTNALLRYIMKNQTVFEVALGNGVVTNKKYKTTLEYNTIAKKIIRFKVENYLFILDMHILEDTLTKMHIPFNKVDRNKYLIIGIDMNEKSLIKISLDSSFVDEVMKLIPEEYSEDIKKIGRKSNGGKLLSYSMTKPLNKSLPLILLLAYFEGFDAVMKKANIEYELIPKTDKDSLVEIDLFDWGLTEMADGFIKWKRYPMENSLLLNGLNKLPINIYNMEELESKDMYVYLLTNIYSYANQSFNLDQYYDFMIDPITKEILIDMNLPTDLVSLCLLANKMLKTDEFTPESDLTNMRLRGNEIIAYHAYKAITDAYGQYRKTQHRKNPKPVSVQQDIVLKKMLTTKASAMTDASSLNPLLEIAKLHEVTYKGENGTNEEHAFKLNVRAYNETMLGVLGVTTSPDSGVGIKRQLSLEPNITSTRGYIDIAGKEHVEELNSAQLMAPSELLTPLGMQHDDPTRTSMSYKQSMYMVMVEDSDSALIGNGAEKALPYHLSSEFVVTAEDDGVVVDKKEDFIVVKYKNGKFRSIDTSLHLKKNSASGFYIESRLVSNLNVGDEISKNDVLAWDDKAFKKNPKNGEASMRLGPLLKAAIIPEWDIYEDSAPISANASRKMTTTMAMPVKVSLNKSATVSRMMKVGDHINAGEAIIVFDNYSEDEDVMKMLQSLRENEAEDIIESNSSKKISHYTGTISKIDIATTVELDELSESLREIVEKYWKGLEKREKVLDKYSNSDDMNFYKSGNVITTTPEPIKPDYQGRINGEKVDEGVVITFYVSFKDTMARGDKLASQFALKGITSHVLEEGMEPRAESRPEEPIDLIIAPLSVSARKVPSVFISMPALKLLIEAKRHLKDFWENN